MKLNIGSILNHYSDANKPHGRHQCCPKTTDSWCKFQQDKLNGTETQRKNYDADADLWKNTGSEF